MENSENKSTSDTEGESLEGSSQPKAGGATGATPIDGASTDKPKKKHVGFFERFSVYLLLFILLMVVAGIVTVTSILNSRAKPSKSIKTQTLSQSDLSQLANSDVTVGDAKQVLNIQSNAVFAGQVLLRGDLQVAGKLQLGGALAVSALQVSGSAVFGSAQVNQNLNVQGDTALAGQLTIQKGLNVNGNSTFNGSISTSQLTATTLQLSGDLNLTHHVNAGGVNPGRTSGSALGSGGTASVSGSDTAGSITINTGSGPVNGCLITVNFATKYNATPHVVASPIGAAAGGLGYYVTRTTTGFSVCTTNAPPAGETFGFDYIVFD